MDRTHSEQRGSLTGPQSRSKARIERDLRAFELHLAGLSVRAVCDEIGLKSSDSGWAAIERGKRHARERGIDLDISRVEIHSMFKRTAGLLMETLEEQREKGRQRFFVDQFGKKTMQRDVGICPRTAGELSRSLNRWATFLGLQDAPPEVNQQTTLIQLAAPSDGAAFGEKWSQQAIRIEATGPSTGPTAQLSPADPSQLLNEALLNKQLEPEKGAA